MSLIEYIQSKRGGGEGLDSDIGYPWESIKYKEVFEYLMLHGGDGKGKKLYKWLCEPWNDVRYLLYQDSNCQV